MSLSYTPETDLDWEAEKICRWGAARAGVIVVAPFVGTMALMANEVYMITRLGDLRGVELEEGAVLGLLSSLGAAFVGQTLVTLIPFAPVQIPVGISVTYAVGKVADAWIKAGRPEDIAVFKEVYEQARQEGMDNIDEFTNMNCKSQPLGDENKRFNIDGNKLFRQVMTAADQTEKNLTDRVQRFGEKILKPLVQQGKNWLQVQSMEDLKNRQVIVPYTEIISILRRKTAGSDILITDLRYSADNRLMIAVSSEEYGAAEILLSVRSFIISKTHSAAEFMVEDFSVRDNSIAEFILDLVGSKLILSLADVLFEKIDLENERLITEYSKRIWKVDFTESIKASRLSEPKVMEKSLLDFIKIDAITPMPQGLKLSIKAAE